MIILTPACIHKMSKLECHIQLVLSYRFATGTVLVSWTDIWLCDLLLSTHLFTLFTCFFLIIRKATESQCSSEESSNYSNTSG